MYFKSKLISLLILAITATLCSRVMFALFNDPEGPNLLIVMVLAAFVFLLSLAVYFFNPSPKSTFHIFLFLLLSGGKRLLSVIFIQVLIVTALYFFLK